MIGGLAGAGLGAFTGALAGSSEIPAELEQQFNEAATQAYERGKMEGKILGTDRTINRLREDPSVLHEIARKLPPSQREALIQELRTETIPLMKLFKQGQ